MNTVTGRRAVSMAALTGRSRREAIFSSKGNQLTSL
jgi:hypothetical protein